MGTCEEKIDMFLSNRLGEMAIADKYNRALEEWKENIFSVAKNIVYKVQLSWRSPADWFEIEVEPDGNYITNIVYHLSDLFDHAERELSGEDFDLAKKIFSYLVNTQKEEKNE